MNAELQRPESQPTAVSENSPLNFEAFARQPEYVEVNANLIREFVSHLPNEFCHVDVATGTGMAPKLLIEESQATGKKGTIICVDPNSISLEIARKTTPLSENVSVEFIKEYGQNLKELLRNKISIPKDGVDGVSILDAIHEIPGENVKKQVLSSMADILKPGGVLALNSAFTTEAISKSFRDWAQWKRKAVDILKGTRVKHAPTIVIHSPDTYRKMVEKAGLTGLVVIHEETKNVDLTKQALEAISMYPAFINGVFEDIQFDRVITEQEKSNALIKAVDEVFNRLKITSLPRVWWEIIAQKTPA